MHRFNVKALLPAAVRCLFIVGALSLPMASIATPTGACPLVQDPAAPIESRIDSLIAGLDDCDEAHTIDDETVLKTKALLIKLRADVAEVRRRHHGDLLEGDRSRFSSRLGRILAQLS